MSKVLIVDDSDVIARLLHRSLEMAGHEVVEVTADAPALLNPSNPLWCDADVLVCDLHMPTVNGLELLAVAHTYHPRLHLIVFTGLSEFDADVQAAAAFADRILYKPNDVLRIASAVEELAR